MYSAWVDVQFHHALAVLAASSSVINVGLTNSCSDLEPEWSLAAYFFGFCFFQLGPDPLSPSLSISLSLCLHRSLSSSLPFPCSHSFPHCAYLIYASGHLCIHLWICLYVCMHVCVCLREIQLYVTNASPVPFYVLTHPNILSFICSQSHKLLLWLLRQGKKGSWNTHTQTMPTPARMHFHTHHAHCSELTEGRDH